MFIFDMKGSKHDRQVLVNPEDIFDIDADYEEYKDLVLKDIDFIKSFNKLDITNMQSSIILPQLVKDAELLRNNNFMDYSILMFIIIKPYTSVRTPTTFANMYRKTLLQSTFNEIHDIHKIDYEEEEKQNVINQTKPIATNIRKIITKSKNERYSRYNSPAIRINKINHRYSWNSPDRFGSQSYFNPPTHKNDTLNLFNLEVNRVNVNNTPKINIQSESPIGNLSTLKIK